MEGDVTLIILMFSLIIFQSTPSAWRETADIVYNKYSRDYFNPLPPHGGRLVTSLTESKGNYFNPLPPHGGRLTTVRLICRICHFNPLPPHGGRHTISAEKSMLYLFQSTPSAWRETKLRHSCFLSTKNFNPLPPHGGRLTDNIKLAYDNPFQSTPSAWRETVPLATEIQPVLYFNPLPPHGGRPSSSACSLFRLSHFNPLPPHGGRLQIPRVRLVGMIISIHSLRMEGDAARLTSIREITYFNPLPPHGGRLQFVAPPRNPNSFQSTPSAWRETLLVSQ